LNSYRKVSRRSPKGQTFRPVPGPKAPPPANQPWRAAPLPGNANSPFAARPITPHKPLFPVLGRAAGRFVPYLGWILFAYELYKYFYPTGDHTASPGFVLKGENSLNFGACKCIEYWCTNGNPGPVAYMRFFTGTYAQFVGPFCDISALNLTGDEYDKYQVTNNPAVRSAMLYVKARFQNNPNQDRRRQYQYYEGTGGYDYGVIRPTFHPLPTTATPSLAPLFVPETVPPKSPQPYPMHIPYRILPHLRPNPWASPTEQTQRGYWVYPYRDPDFDPIQPETYPRPKPDEVPLVQKPLVYDITPYGAYARSLSGRAGKYHKRTPPSRNEKEKKSRASKFVAGFGMAYLAFTEALDVIGALWKAMPDSKPHGLNPFEKARYIASHMEQLDMAEAVKNLVENQIEDAIIGNLNRGARQSSGLKVSPSHAQAWVT